MMRRVEGNERKDGRWTWKSKEMMEQDGGRVMRDRERVIRW